MKTDIQTVGFHAREDLLDFANDKLGQLGKYYNRITGVDLYLKLINDSQENNKKVEMKVFLPGPTLFAEHRSNNFNESIVEVTDKIVKQLKRKNQLEKEKR